MNAAGQAALELAATHEQAGRFADAEAAFRRAIAEGPQAAVARFNFACFLRRRGRLEEALEEHQAALDLAIERPEEVLSNMAVIQTELKREAAARLLLERALSINPAYPPAMFNLALQHEAHGERALALALYRRILEIDPFWHVALVHIAHAETVTDPDGEIVKRLRRALRRSNLDALTRESLHFALGKALDDCRRHDEAFAHYALGNAQSRVRLPRYDRAAVERGVARAIDGFTAERIGSVAPVSGVPLVFVTGLYRSGSTLFAQALAAHPRVTVDGDIDRFMRVPLSLESGDWRALAQGYVDELGDRHPGAEIVVGRRPDAFWHLGLLKAVFPNARFVHAVRDARDTALSIWFQQFDARIAYATDLADIAHHQRQCRRLMAHWHGLFGAHIFDADYDEYVRDPRGVTGRLFDFLGLDLQEGWPGTPPYARSSGRWRNYERQLAPFAFEASSSTTS